MNFYGHLKVAMPCQRGPLFGLGAMLPDLENMAAARLPIAPTGELAEGVRFHHATDAAFHRTSRFGKLTSRAVEELEAAGLGRGPARAVAHVGIELLLDGELCRDPAEPGLAAYREALSAGRALIAAAHRSDHASSAAASLGHFGGLLERLLAAPIPQAYRDPAFVAARLEHILARRPRLALSPGQPELVCAWSTRAQPEVQATCAALMDEVTSRLQWG